MDEDSGAVLARWREGLTRSAARAYEAAHGNPIPEQRRGTRWKVEPRVAVTVSLVLVLLALVTYWSVKPEPVTSVPMAAMPMDPVPSAPGDVGAVADAVVHVAGAVHQPGLVTVAAGARVAEAVDIAGGLTASADAASINLARTVVDGEQIYVPEVGEAAQAGKVNLNRANASELEALPGIGPVLAERIVLDREAHGPFASVADLARVSGVGPALIDKIAATATV